jgi:tRNA-splicing ligase RtcB
MIVLNPTEHGTSLPIKLWPTEPDGYWTDPSFHDVYQQFRNLANHPLAHKWVCGMPDYHLGYGMPIGGVLATKGGVVPNAVGVDIGCGMIAERTNIAADSLTRDDLTALCGAIRERVPVGFRHHEQQGALPSKLMSLALDNNLAKQVVGQHWDRARYQLGTLGGGNHFIELQRCREDGRLWIMLHSGSRNVGKQVCDHYDKVAKGYMDSFKVKVDRDLAFLPDTVPEHGAYLAEMRWCMAFAEANRKAMLEAVHEAFGSLQWPDLGIDLVVDTHHNFAAMEHHAGENLMIHRKGAVKATGLVTIPGSMGTASFIGEGLTPAESFNTCSHGAGRVMGRKVANKTISHERAVESMAHVVYGVREGKYDEMPDCYKKIDEVMAAQADLVMPLWRLVPLAVVKG